MARFELILPKMGESVAEATIIKWVKNIGDTIEADETILEIATDKVDSEVPSPVSGKLLEKLVKEDDVAAVGSVIAILETDMEAELPISTQQNSPKIEVETKIEDVPGLETVTANEEPKSETTSADKKFYSPLVKSIADSEGVSLMELDSIKGTGAEGRVNKQDILAYVESRNTEKTSKPIETITQEVPKPTPQKVVMPSAGDEIVEMDRMRKLIAEHMIMSKQTSAHVTSFVEADVTNLVMWRNKVKDAFEKKHGEKITFTPIFIEAIAKAIKDFPMINISVSGTNIIVKKDINIGMAAALPSGNLIVPVIKNADQMNLIGLTKSVNDLANRARANKLKPDDTQGGTYTITNVGTFGNVLGTPIINQPQVAVLAVGAIKKKPAVIETEYGDVIAIRHMMFLSHSYDHRVVDGALGGMFVRKVADYLEAFNINREF